MFYKIKCSVRFLTLTVQLKCCNYHWSKFVSWINKVKMCSQMDIRYRPTYAAYVTFMKQTWTQLNKLVSYVHHYRPRSFNFRQIRWIITFLVNSLLKRLNQANIVKRSVILFWLLNLTIWCKHVHRLELQKFLNFCAAHLRVKRDIEKKIPYFLFWTCKISSLYLA